MNRRQFGTNLAACAIGLGLGAKSLSSATPPKSDQPRIAITMDDFNWQPSLKLNSTERNRAILGALKSHGDLKAALFVAGKHADNETGKALLGEWDKAGHMIANHSYSHSYLNSSKITAEVFNADILKGEAVIRGFPRFQKSFRFPYLKEGDSALERDEVRKFLKQNGYRIGHVTIDASDWAVDSRLTKRLTKDPTADVKPYRDFYLAHMWERAVYYDDLSKKALGRSVKHTLLVHFNLLNALFLADLLDMFQTKGWKLIDAVDAFKDPVFSSEPKIVPAGESIIWALAKESGRFDSLLRYPGEDSQYEDAKMDKMNL
ncbi:MAG TPA: polysaccharide deacetylase family protein [Pyrinomonadaceae bacterium]|nr:polysaccharide deacetylase family protein [Pyrinomonadaceae bacterium]